MGPTFTVDLRVQADYGQIYIYSPAAWSDAGDGGNPLLDALDDATSSRRFVGTAAGLLDLMTPGQWNFDTPMRIEVWPAEPEPDSAEWDHEVDIDLDVPDGTLIFEASGGGGSQLSTEIPAGRYRARVSGGGYTELGFAGAEGDDHYRLRLWERATDSPPLLRKSWPGWESFR